MKKLAEKLAAAAEAMKQGDAKDAASQMGELAQDMEAMQQELSEMEMLDDALQQIASAKELDELRELRRPRLRKVPSRYGLHERHGGPQRR